MYYHDCWVDRSFGCLAFGPAVSGAKRPMREAQMAAYQLPYGLGTSDMSPAPLKAKVLELLLLNH